MPYQNTLFFRSSAPRLSGFLTGRPGDFILKAVDTDLIGFFDVTEAAVVFSSFSFLLLFLPILLLLYFARRGMRWRNAVLLIASLFFYAWGEPVCVLAMIFSAAVNYFCAAAIASAKDARAKKAALAAGVGVSLALLFYFKYFGFAVRIFASLFSLDIAAPRIRLPIGISFYTFQVLTYTVDVYRGKSPAQKSFASLLLYVSCFPQLIAGPIVQYSDVEPQLAERSASVEEINSGMRRFITGLAKKVLLANICGAALEALPHGAPGETLSLLGSWYHAFLYTLQIYFDFSAYSDMAIGLGLVLGFRYKENFDYPYISLSATEFWRRWHISLGSFFRDYVYIPLGGSRGGGLRTARNIVIVWTLTGLWHGADWNFVIWGAYYALLLLLERFVLKGALERVPAPVRRALCFIAAMLGWTIFYQTDLPSLGRMLAAMAGRFAGGAAPLLDAASLAVMKRYTIFPLLAFVFALPVVPAAVRAMERAERGEKTLAVCRAVLPALLLALSLVFLAGQSFNPFIYFRF